MGAMAKIRIFNDHDGDIVPTHVEINGVEIKGVRRIKYDASADEIPKVTLELYSLMDSGIDVDNAELCIKFHPQTVSEAMQVLGISGVYDDEDGKLIYIMDDGK